MQLISLPLAAQTHSHLHVQGYCLSRISALSSHMCSTLIMHTHFSMSTVQASTVSVAFRETQEGGLLTTDNVPCSLGFRG
jgi:hypothetical protein